MTNKDHFDLIVIGSGPAGEKAATQAAFFGRRPVIVERDRTGVGGAALHNAGIPTKTLREAALYISGFGHRDLYGVGLNLDGQADFRIMRERALAVWEQMTTQARRNLDRHGVELVIGQARLMANRGHVHVALGEGEERSLTADAIVIAAGSRPFHPPGFPFDDPNVHDSETILQVSGPFSTLLVIGCGAIGCEYASIFGALGVKVTMVDSAERLLSFADPEIAGVLEDVFRKDGMDLRLNTHVASIERIAGRLEVRLSDGQLLAPEQVLVAAGRVGNTEELGLEAAGVAVDARGRIKVDGQFQTNIPGIYAAGDIIGPPSLASVSMEQGRLAASAALGLPYHELPNLLAPLGVYSVPEVALIGLSEDAARAQGIACEVGRGWFRNNPRANIAGATDGLLKLVFRRDNRQLLGVQIVGEVASELIHLGQAILNAGESIDYFIHATLNVPTYSAIYKDAALDGVERVDAGGLRAARTPQAPST